jgi:hypothetical protein
MKHHGKKLKDALFFVKNKRYMIQPKSGFMEKLRKLDLELYGVNSLSEAEYYKVLLMDMGFEEDEIPDSISSV